jgi:hypothetical protein
VHKHKLGSVARIIFILFFLRDRFWFSWCVAASAPP